MCCNGRSWVEKGERLEVSPGRMKKEKKKEKKKTVRTPGYVMAGAMRAEALFLRDRISLCQLFFLQRRNEI